MKPRLVGLVIVGYLAVVVQTTVVPLVSLGAVGPDLLLTVAMFLALFAPKHPALVGGWILGLAKDVTGGGPVGAWAVLFLAAAATLIEVRDLLFIQRALTQAALMAVVALPMNLAYVAARWALAGGRPTLTAVGLVVGCAVFTAVVTPPVVWFLGRFRRVLGLVPERRIA